MRITCFGAARVVTGSCHLIETGEHKILIDCGLFQGNKDLNRLNYNDFDFDPASIDIVIVTHGHIDHCGLLPKLTKNGYKGKIYCSEPTADLLPVMLEDSAYIQEKDTEHENYRRKKNGLPPREPLYTTEDVQKMEDQIFGIPYNKMVEIFPNISFCLRDAGHIIGSGMVEFFTEDDGEWKKIVFSGDIGQWDVPIIEDPSYIKKADYVFMETTYGGRLHKQRVPRVELLYKYIKMAVEKKGKLLIPCFALERSQELLYSINMLKQTKDDFPNIPIFLDSPLAIKATEVFKKHPEVFDEEAKTRYKNPFEFPGLTFTSTAAESKKLNELKGSAIIIAGSGMCNAGRIRHHLKYGISNSDNVVLFVGYQAEGTLGRHLLNGKTEIRMMGGLYPVNATIARINSFSAHADQSELLQWIKNYKEKPKKVFLIHGELKSMEALGEKLKEENMKWESPKRGDTIIL